MNHNRFIMGIVISTAFMVLLISGSVILFNKWSSGSAQINGREPLSRLGYCSSMRGKPCIASFGLDSSANAVINILTTRSFPDFYLKIKHDVSESIYECQKLRVTSTNVSCVGKPIPPGERLQFLLFSIDEDTLLAEGQFSVIGLALATPEIYSTSTPNPLIHPPR